MPVVDLSLDRSTASFKTRTRLTDQTDVATRTGVLTRERTPRLAAIGLIAVLSFLALILSSRAWRSGPVPKPADKWV
ncbi:MAG: hypothetical protein QOG52_539, partial [Frankiaceae bacterium]|nr:hypothetical protein [Frankiaceae bacterium]